MTHRLTLALAAMMLLAGCSDGGGSSETETPTEAPGTGEAPMLVRYTTGAPLVPQTTTIDNSVTPAEVYNQFPRYGGFSCCTTDSNDVAGLVAQADVMHMRVNLTWTNTPENQANLGMSPCVPFACYSAPRATSLPSLGEQTTSVNLLTMSCEQCNTFDLGVDIQDAIVTTGLPYTLDIQILPAPDAIGLYDPHLIEVAPNATVFAEILSPYSGSGDVGLVLYGDDDYPIEYLELSGNHGDMIPLSLETGDYVIFDSEWTDAAVRFWTDGTPSSLEIPRLQETFEMQELLDVPNVMLHTGSIEIPVPPGSLDMTPWFFFDDGAQAQHGGGDSRFVASLEADPGTVSYSETARLGTSGPIGPCISCYGIADWIPANIMDSDQSYSLDYTVQDAAGQIVLFTASYTRA